LQIAYFDYLTGLHNRRFFFENGEHVFDQAKQNQETLAIAALDIDHFKKINDSFGHDVGDQLLKEVAKMLKLHFEDSALLGRIGGEEFAMLFQSFTLDDAQSALESFRQAVENMEVSINNQVIKTTISIGLTGIEANTLGEMVKQADHNLYQAKAQGRNCVVVG